MGRGRGDREWLSTSVPSACRCGSCGAIPSGIQLRARGAASHGAAGRSLDRLSLVVRDRVRSPVSAPDQGHVAMVGYGMVVDLDGGHGVPEAGSPKPRRGEESEPGQVRTEYMDARYVRDVEDDAEGPSSAEARLKPDTNLRGVPGLKVLPFVSIRRVQRVGHGSVLGQHPEHRLGALDVALESNRPSGFQDILLVGRRSLGSVAGEPPVENGNGHPRMAEVVLGAVEGQETVVRAYG